MPFLLNLLTKSHYFSNGAREVNPFDDGDGEEEWDDGGALVDHGEKGVPVRYTYQCTHLTAMHALPP